MTVSILLADDHPMIRQGLLNLLGGIPEFQVVGEAADGLEAIHKIGLTKPDILVVDMMMPNVNGLEILMEVKKLSPNTQSIVFSMQSNDSYVVEALRHGADGYILKDAGPGELITAIHSVLRGERYLSPKISEQFIAGKLKIEENPLDMYQTLTPRERQILQMTVEGDSSTKIGEKLEISPRTVEIHRSSCMKKLGLKNHTELIRYAVKRGILPLDE